MMLSNGNIFHVTGPLWGESPGHSPHKGQWCRALMFSLICAWANSWVNNRDTSYFRSHHANYDVPVMSWWKFCDVIQIKIKDMVTTKPCASQFKSQEWDWSKIATTLLIRFTGIVNCPHFMSQVISKLFELCGEIISKMDFIVFQSLIRKFADAAETVTKLKNTEARLEVSHSLYGARGPFHSYRKISNIRRTKSLNLNVPRLVLQLYLPKLLMPVIKSRMKM